jgi:DNA-binding NarL/FixJ family response regulator
MRIMVVEDSVLLREGLVRLLTDAGHEVPAARSDADGLAGHVAEVRPDLVLLDVRLPPAHSDEGVRAALDILDAAHPVPVLVLSQYVERRHAVDLLGHDHVGIGYVLKDRVIDVADFLRTVERVAAGEQVIDPVVVRQLVASARSPLQRLTRRESEVLNLMAEGLSNAGIAERLVLSAGAVEKHIGNVFLKLGLPPDLEAEHRRVTAVLMWLDQAATELRPQ